jgi:hypothetical protein
MKLLPKSSLWLKNFISQTQSQTGSKCRERERLGVEREGEMERVSTRVVEQERVRAKVGISSFVRE